MAEENKLNIFDVNNESDDLQEYISKANKVTDEVVKKAAEKIDAVSYTHLDVYKRQT